MSSRSSKCSTRFDIANIPEWRATPRTWRKRDRHRLFLKLLADGRHRLILGQGVILSTKHAPHFVHPAPHDEDAVSAAPTILRQRAACPIVIAQPRADRRIIPEAEPTGKGERYDIKQQSGNFFPARIWSR